MSREKFDESLDVLKALLTEDEVSWDGKYYKFDPITVMPRPVRPGGPRMMMAVLRPEAIRAGGYLWPGPVDPALRG